MPSTSSDPPPLWALADCNNFYASCEQLFRPDLLNRPVVVLSNNDGCIVARSKEAKALGIKMGEPEFKVRGFLKAKGVTVFSSNYALYGDISARVMLTLESVCPVVEQYSIDEAFVPFDKVLAAQAEDVAWALRETVKKKTGITISVGVAPTRTLAKVANYLAKRGGGVTVLDDMAAMPEVLRNFPIGEVWGIGRRLAAKLETAGVRTAYDLAARDDAWIRKEMTITGLRTAHELRGRQAIMLDNAPPPRRTLVTSRSFGAKIRELRPLSEAVSTFTARAAERLRKENLLAGGLMVFIRTSIHAAGQQHEVAGQVNFQQATTDTLIQNQVADVAFAGRRE